MLSIPQSLEQTLSVLYETGRARFATVDEIASHLMSTSERRRMFDEGKYDKMALELGMDIAFTKALLRDKRFRALVMQEVLDGVYTTEAKRKIWETIAAQLASADVPLGQKRGIMELIEQQQGLLRAKRIQAEISQVQEVIVSYAKRENPYIEALAANRLALTPTRDAEQDFDEAPPGGGESVIEGDYYEDRPGAADRKAPDHEEKTNEGKGQRYYHIGRGYTDSRQDSPEE